ncbi:hypothetical protein GWI33_006867 [Rhynchophorus ferrugineus]|uniref:Uncharacterized protein n=1 Tax=Rhynchophorus ferrugineus TaxID=354439 RepID=A0A834IEB1_RHYFE|nr:hypothetical protein GWI33_006867 [Rhynchophorus ferrugineus]
MGGVTLLLIQTRRRRHMVAISLNQFRLDRISHGGYTGKGSDAWTAQLSIRGEIAVAGDEIDAISKIFTYNNALS